MQDFKKLEIWIMAKNVALKVYKLSSAFPRHEVWGITNQLRRASVSISTNIAEGCGRATQADLARFIQISIGSTTEIDSIFCICHELGYITANQYEGIATEIETLRRKLIAFNKKVRAT